MSKFEKVEVKHTMSSADKAVTVEIVKYRKKGTKREFFRPEVDGKALSKTMFARMYDAENLATAYFKHLSEQAK